ncbi:MAG: TetR/AcrR family transcriptional regulator [Nevskiaceae bacterium]|nr:MAG: TetR/AcrR family transcriptional regulator [Nevskiaceae bacterium]
MPAPSAASEARQNLTANAWADAALEAIATGGLDAVAVEPLARKLGVTKGSFYWHFNSRGELIRAALDLWEKSETVDILARIEPTSDPYERIVNVFKQANASYRAGRLYLAIAAGEDHPVVNEYVRRVSEARMNYLRDCYRDLGFSESQARHWARFAYATFMGNLQIRRDTPDAMPQGAEFNEYLRLMITTLIPREVAADGAPEHPHVVPMRRAGTP